MHDHDPQPWQCDDCGQMNIGPFCECVIDHGDQPNLRPWQCDECGHVNPWHVTMCPCEFWYPAEPAPDLSHWLTVSIQEGAE